MTADSAAVRPRETTCAVPIVERARDLWDTESSTEGLLHRLAEAYADPNANKMQEYVTEPNFYDATDDIIRLTRQAKQHSVDGEELRAAVDSAAEGSLYARAESTGVPFTQTFAVWGFDNQTG